MFGLSPQGFGFEAELAGTIDLTHLVADSEYGLAVVAEGGERSKGEEDVLVAALLAALAEEVPFPLFADRVSSAAHEAQVRAAQRHS